MGVAEQMFGGLFLCRDVLSLRLICRLGHLYRAAGCNPI